MGADCSVQAIDNQKIALDAVFPKTGVKIFFD
jgi:hypothetical protein